MKEVERMNLDNLNASTTGGGVSSSNKKSKGKQKKQTSGLSVSEEDSIGSVCKQEQFLGYCVDGSSDVFCFQHTLDKLKDAPKEGSNFTLYYRHTTVSNRINL